MWYHMQSVQFAIISPGVLIMLLDLMLIFVIVVFFPASGNNFGMEEGCSSVMWGLGLELELWCDVMWCDGCDVMWRDVTWHDMTCRINKTIAPACPRCSREPESVLYFVLKCPVYDRQRNLFIDKIVSRSPSFPNLDDVQKLKYIVDLDCPPEVINQCCKFIAEICALRERQSITNSWWSNITYVLEIIYLLVSIIWVFFVLVFWSSNLTLSSTNVVHLDNRVIFLHVCYDLYDLLVKLTSVLVMPIKILNLYDMIWYDVMWCDVTWHEIYDMIWYDTIWYDTIRHDTARHDTIRYDTTRYDMIYDMMHIWSILLLGNRSIIIEMIYKLRVFDISWWLIILITYVQALKRLLGEHRRGFDTPV